MTRLEANRQIIQRISEYVEEFPDQRFHQVLQNMNIEHPGTDEFYVESEETLNSIVK